MDRILSLPYSYPHPTFGYEYWRMWKNDIRIRQNQILDMYQILADHMRILIGYVKINTVKEKLDRYTRITFYLIYNNIKCDTYYDIIVYILLLHHIHCHSAFIAMDYMTSGAKCRFGCHGWCRKTQNISCYSCKNRILFTINFSPTQNIKIYCLISLKNCLFHTDIIIKHLQIGYCF